MDKFPADKSAWANVLQPMKALKIKFFTLLTLKCILPGGGMLVKVHANWVNLISQRRSSLTAMESLLPMNTGMETHSLREKSMYTEKQVGFPT